MRLRVADTNVDGAIRRIQANADAALLVVAENALADCTDFVPYLTGAMRRSGHTLVSGGKAFVEWGADSDTGAYTRIQYENDSLNHDTVGNAINAPRAQGHWFEGAKEERFAVWLKMFERKLVER